MRGLSSLIRGAGSADTPAQTPQNTIVYAIGDIHGRLDLLKRLQEQIRKDARDHADKRRVIVYLGDYVDRGLNSRDVIDRLIGDPLPGFESVHLKGNHEDAMLKFLDDIEIAPGWMNYGGDTTLYSYGVTVPRPPFTPEKLSAAQAEFVRKLPRRHLDFLQALDIRHEEGDYFFVHAGVRPGRSLEEQREEDLLWIRDVFLFSADDFGKVI
ncbi:MAG: metallophosphoesterase, partial [Alphaproteobacteria bacterium]